MVLFCFLFAWLIAYSKTETLFLFCCAQLHPLNTPDKSISTAPCTPGAGLWRALFKRHFKTCLRVARCNSCSKIGICRCLPPALSAVPARADLPCGGMRHLVSPSIPVIDVVTCAGVVISEQKYPRLKALNTCPNPQPPCLSGLYGDLLLANLSCARK